MGRVLNARGEVAHVVHQWDRKKPIVELIDDTMFFTLPEEKREYPSGYPKKRRSVDQIAIDNKNIQPLVVPK